MNFDFYDNRPFFAYFSNIGWKKWSMRRMGYLIKYHGFGWLLYNTVVYKTAGWVMTCRYILQWQVSTHHCVLYNWEFFENRKYIGELEAKFENVLGGLSGAHIDMFMKNRRWKISWNCPFNSSSEFPNKVGSFAGPVFAPQLHSENIFKVILEALRS